MPAIVGFNERAGPVIRAGEVTYGSPNGDAPTAGAGPFAGSREGRGLVGKASREAGVLAGHVLRTPVVGVVMVIGRRRGSGFEGPQGTGQRARGMAGEISCIGPPPPNLPVRLSSLS